MEETTNSTLLNTKVSDMTVAEQLKLSAIICAAVLAVPVAISTVSFGVATVRASMYNRRMRKLTKEIESELEEN